MQFKISNRKLCNIIWSSHTEIIEDKIEAMTNGIYRCRSYTESEMSQIKAKLKNSFFPLYQKKWRSVRRNKRLFLSKFKNYLQEYFVVDFVVTSNSQVSENNALSRDMKPKSHAKRGRPSTPYEESSVRTRKRYSDELASNFSKEQLTHALLRKEKNLEKSDDSKTDRALAMFVDLDMTAKKYDKFRLHNNRITGIDLYPPYKHIVEAKDRCIPENIEFSESGAKVDLISLLEHTVKRILLQFDINTLPQLASTQLELVGKWGMDGASGQQTTRQKWPSQLGDSFQKCEEEDSYVDFSAKDDESEFENDTYNVSENSRNTMPSDSSVFIVSFAPLQLKSSEKVIWSNETPNSVFYCRVVEFAFIKENNDSTRECFKYYSKVLNKIDNYIFDFKNFCFQVRFDLKLTMLDGKLCNSLTYLEATTRCNICLVGPKLINDLKYVKKLTCRSQYYKFGLSSLHCWIRFLEYLLHISYNLDFKKSAARTPKEKQLKQKRKERVQSLLKVKLSLTVDVVKQGYGTTNTGNVARTFFSLAKEVAKYTGLDECLIIRLHNVLQTISSGRIVSTMKFKKYCYDTAELCIKLYGWYNMPPSVHKVLVHGSDIIQSFNVPIGWLSEEPQEGNNRVFCRARMAHSRMSSRLLANKDILRYMLIHSDPLISSLRHKKERETVPLSKEAENLLQ